MRKASTRACTPMLLAALLGLGCFAHTKEPVAAEVMTLDFEANAVGTLPTGFSSAVTGGGGPASWMVVEDFTALSGGKVLAQTSTDKTSFRFPLCVYDGFTAADLTVSVSFKPVAGTVDQAAGLVARYRDKDNYYVVRANALENNVRLYKIERGNRKQFAGANVKVPSGEWQTLALEVKGTHFWVLLNDTLLFEADDATFKNAGKVGLWTKADSVTYFDDLRVKTDATR
jgi:3-keto-disaccharide hydrolase